MDFFQELESMATNVTLDADTESHPSEKEITRWQTLFGYSHQEAIDHLEALQHDLSRYRVSNDHWDLIRAEKESEGYSRGAYEHWVGTLRQSKPSHQVSSSIETSTSSGSYLVLLEGALSTPDIIQDIVNLSEPPKVIQATSEETSDAMFCRIDGDTKRSIENWLSHQKSTFKPTFVRLSKAKKDLAADSIYSTLGLDSTLPHHRPDSNLSFESTLPQNRGCSSPTTVSPLQDKYPVWYFFYGTLADTTLLAHLLSLPAIEVPLLIPASISRGVIRTWQNKYKALVNGAETDFVHGSAYEVTSREREEALLFYETEMYEVLRCCIMMEGQEVRGLTFRFLGSL